MRDAIGWIATLLFAGSYLHRGPDRMRAQQGVAALVWIAYGILMRAAPVIVANALVCAMALGTAWRSRPAAVAERPVDA